MSQPAHDLQSYLAALRRALGSAPPGLVADALADAQEHLRGAQDAAPGRSDADILEDYGSPQEVAAEYLRQDLPPASPFARPCAAPVAPPPRRPHAGFFAILADPLAYGALIYMLLTGLTGIFYSLWALGGISLSLGLSFLIIGIPFFLLFMASVRLLSYLEGRLVEVLLGVRMPRRPPSAPLQRTLKDRIMAVLADARSWSSLAYMLLLLPLGTVYFLLASFSLVLPGALVFTGVWQVLNCWRPFEMVAVVPGDEPGVRLPGFELSNGAGAWHFHGPAWMAPWLHTPLPGLAFVLAGAVLFLLLLHLIRALARLQGRIAEHLLVRL